MDDLHRRRARRRPHRVRVDGRFFASLDRRNGALLVKLPADRVRQLRFGLAVVGPQADT
jgi:hypothetical protein